MGSNETLNRADFMSVPACCFLLAFLLALGLMIARVQLMDIHADKERRVAAIFYLYVDLLLYTFSQLYSTYRNLPGLSNAWFHSDLEH